MTSSSSGNTDYLVEINPFIAFKIMQITATLTEMLFDNVYSDNVYSDITISSMLFVAT